MANPEHLKILNKGIKIWNTWRNNQLRGTPDLSNENLNGRKLENVDFRNANLHLAELEDADLSYANLENANLSYANLRGVNFLQARLGFVDFSHAFLCNAKFAITSLRGTNFSEAKLNNASLYAADIREANLIRADFTGASIEYSNLTRSELRGSNFQNVHLQYFTLSEVDLSEVVGLDEVIHEGPSSIGIDTIYMSKGKIPHKFLREAGVPENFIEYMNSLTGKAFDYYSCFISYSTKDEDFARRLYADLQTECVRCWFAPEDLKIGQKIRPGIDEAIIRYDKLLLVLSESSVKSTWVEKEVETAFEKERKENKTVLFPVRLDEAIFNTDVAWAADIRRTRNIGDFTNWQNHAGYKNAFDRLLRDLKAEDKKE